MGRAKLPIKQINAERSRNTTFTKRRRGLKKKMFEFSTLCDVDACIIIYASAQDSSPQTWPEDPAEVRRVIERFQRAPKEERDKRQQDISTLLRSKNKKLQDELEQRRRENAGLASLLLSNRSSLEDMNLNDVLDLQFRLNSKIMQVSDGIKHLEQQCLPGGPSEVQPQSTNSYFQSPERRRVSSYVAPLQPAPILLPTATMAPPESEEALLHWGYNSNLGATGCWFGDHDAALITAAASPAYYCTQPTPCVQRQAVLGWASQDSSPSFVGEGSSVSANTIMNDRRTMKLPQNTDSHGRSPYPLPSFSLTPEDMDLLTSLTDRSDSIQGLDHFLECLFD